MVMTQVVDRIIAHPAPVLCLDTCSLLDVWRTLVRVDVEVISTAQGVNDAIVAAPPGVWTIISEQVRVEWERNLSTVRQDVARHLQNTQSALDRVHDVLDRLPLSGRPTRQSLTTLLLDPFLDGLTKSLISNSLLLDLNDASGANALKRNLSRRAPAERGGSIEDCVIIEHYLQLASALKGRALAFPVIFVSSNSRDYGSPGQMLGTLQEDFDAAGLQFAVHLAHAKSIGNWA